MKAAKIIALLGCAIDGALALYFWFLLNKMRRIFFDVGADANFLLAYIGIAGFVIISLVNLFFFNYLRQKSERNENTPNALFIAWALVLFGPFVLSAPCAIAIVGPLYNLVSSSP